MAGPRPNLLITHAIQFNPPLRNEAPYEKSSDYPGLARAPAAFFTRAPACRPILFSLCTIDHRRIHPVRVVS